MNPKTKSAAERRFALWWHSLRGPALVREFAFHPSRKWRFDFAHLPTKTAIEIEGGQWGFGRHNRPQGFAADCEKYNAATRLGWKVIRLTPKQIRAPELERMIAFINLTKP